MKLLKWLFSSETKEGVSESPVKVEAKSESVLVFKNISCEGGIVGGIVSGLTGCYHLEARGKTVSTNCAPEELAKMDKRRLE